MAQHFFYSLSCLCHLSRRVLLPLFNTVDITPSIPLAVASQMAQERPFDPAAEPRTILLNNKMKMPLVGAHVTDGETAKCASGIGVGTSNRASEP